MAYMNVCISKRLKEELAWAIDKWLCVISIKMLFKTVVRTTKKLKNKTLKLYCMHCYVALSNVF